MADDWKEAWQGQEPEGQRIVADVLRQRAEVAHRARKMERIGHTLRITALITIAVGGIFAVDRTAQKIAFGIAALWNMASLLALWHGRRHTGAPELKSCVSFCRAELERKRHAARTVWIWQAGPVLLFIGALAYPGVQHLVADNSHITRAAPFFALLAVWLLIVPMQRRIRMRGIDREIEELKNLEKAAGV